MLGQVVSASELLYRGPASMSALMAKVRWLVVNGIISMADKIKVNVLIEKGIDLVPLIFIDYVL